MNTITRCPSCLNRLDMTGVHFLNPEVNCSHCKKRLLLENLNEEVFVKRKLIEQPWNIKCRVEEGQLNIKIISDSLLRGSMRNGIYLFLILVILSSLIYWGFYISSIILLVSFTILLLVKEQTFRKSIRVNDEFLFVRNSFEFYEKTILLNDINQFYIKEEEGYFNIILYSKSKTHTPIIKKIQDLEESIYVKQILQKFITRHIINDK